jgi:thiol-disulfide isomerase/thioredoxin
MTRINALLLLLAAFTIANLSGCSGETPTAGPVATSEGVGSAPETAPTVDDSQPADDGIEATAEGNTEPPLADVTSAVADVPAADAGSEGTPEVSVSVATPDQFADVIAKHKGKVIFVDFWATWCVPCRKAFPHTVELAKKYPEKLAVVSMALDDADAKEDVLDFLKEQEATFDNLMCSFGGSDESYNAYEIPGSALPYFRIYDREGTLKHTFGYDAENDQGVDEAEVHNALEALIAAE